ncbi:hypothetical protein K2173_008990 [Erythroxylum novogranatense]|uniref:CCHC-type domain-containing protein n=1 Tax=Erythroxylum novogranatense TaxID=1862640 RepID=A0AAV8TVZ9_9ROSI|nr:hypothetical protein K2173_008990 [Erythroxylum novogranatense]
MDSESSFTAITLPVFDGRNYLSWAVRMEAFLEANDLWEAVDEDYDVPELPTNPTVAQIKIHKEKKQKKSKAKACLFSGVTPTIFSKIMTLKTKFEIQKMKESETIKDYSNRLIVIANNVRFLGSNFDDSRIVQKILVTIPERFEATISSLKNSKDLAKISLAELLSALQAQEQRRLMRQEGIVEGAFPVKSYNKKKINNNNAQSFPPCSYCKKTNHPEHKCWWRPDVRCNKCGQLGHVERICNAQQNVKEANQAINGQLEEDELF